MKLTRRSFLLGTTAVIGIATLGGFASKPSYAHGGTITGRYRGSSLPNAASLPRGEYIVNTNSVTAEYVSAGTTTVLGYDNVRVYRVIPRTNRRLYYEAN